MNYSILKQNIDDYITTNGDNDITGQVMREQLNAIITSLGAGYQYIGVATTSTNPGSPDYKCFYIATQVGTYANFGSGGLTVSDGEVAIFYWDTAWHKAVTGAASKAQLDELGHEIGGLRLNDLVDGGNLVFEQGSIVASTGANTNSGSIIRSAGVLPTSVGQLSVPPGFVIWRIIYYASWTDASTFTYSAWEGIGSRFATLNSSYNYARILVQNSGGTAITPDDLISALPLLRPEVEEELAKRVVIEPGKNLLDPAKCTADSYIDRSNGKVAALAGKYVSDYIPVTADGLVCNKIYYGGVVIGQAVYNASKTFLRGFTSNSGYTYQAGDAYIRYTLSTLVEAQVEKGATSTSYAPYNEIGGYPVEVNSVGTEQLKDKSVTLEKLADTPIYSNANGTSYEDDVKELYLLPDAFTSASFISLKQYENTFYLEGFTGTFAYPTRVWAVQISKQELTQNGKVYPLYCTIAGGGLSLGELVGSIVFKDVAHFTSTSTGSVNSINEERAKTESLNPAAWGYINYLAINKIEIALPDTIYAPVGETLQLFYRSIFRCVDYTKYAVKVVCNIGSQFPRYYQVTPAAGNIGNHTLTFTIKDNNDNTLAQKAVTLAVVAVPTSPQSELNILCVGASGTAGGAWASEFKRRLVGSGGSPAGSNLSNIVFVGRKDVTFDGKQVNLEATGGYSFSSYTDTTTARYRFDVTAANEPTINVGDVYANNGNNYTIVEINITPGSGGYFSCTGSGAPSASGTLTKVSGSGSATITYSASSYSGNPFVYNGAINMQQYADDYCNPQNNAHGRIDVVYTELFVNGTQVYATEFATRMSEMQDFITQFRAVFPTCKFCIGLSWNPDIRGGTGVSYGASGDWSDPYGIKYANMNLCNALQKYINDNNLSGYVFILNWLNEFDEENDFLQTTKPVNTRATETEIFGVNGVHPSVVGYNQMADSAWRLFVAKFCQ